jgi:hypothetical protein
MSFSGTLPVLYKHKHTCPVHAQYNANGVAEMGQSVSFGSVAMDQLIGTSVLQSTATCGATGATIATLDLFSVYRSLLGHQI